MTPKQLEDLLFLKYCRVEPLTKLWQIIFIEILANSSDIPGVNNSEELLGKFLKKKLLSPKVIGEIIILTGEVSDGLYWWNLYRKLWSNHLRKTLWDPWRTSERNPCEIFSQNIVEEPPEYSFNTRQNHWKNIDGVFERLSSGIFMGILAEIILEFNRIPENFYTNSR